MPIRASIFTKPVPPPPKPKEDHFTALFGDRSNPQFLLDGAWPNGSAHTSTRVPRYLGKPIILGWSLATPWAHVEDRRCWVATKLGYHRKFGYHGINPLKDFKYVGEFNFAKAGEAIIAAFEEHHDLYIAFVQQSGSRR